jgi:hypothetical protein
MGPGCVCDPTTGDDAFTAADSASQQCVMPCPTVEIEINNTPAANDDLVQVQSVHPPGRPIVDCRIRATSSCPMAATIVLTNPDGRLRFPGPGDRTCPVTVPNDGSWVPFRISGETGSQAIGDAVIQAHCNAAEGELKGQKALTVFWFDQPQINIAAGGAYALSGGRYTVTGAHAVDYSAQARIRPAGVDCSAPQVRNLRIGILQTALAGVATRNTWGNPAVRWRAGVAAGTTIRVPSQYRYTCNQPASANDSEATVAPLYDQPGKGGTLSANSLKPPVGCAGGGAATSFDTPSSPAAATYTLPVRDAGGAEVADVDWGLSSATRADSFDTYVVVFNTASNEFVALRKRGWRTNVDSSAAGAQRASPDAADAAVTANPVTAAPYANEIRNQAANRVTAPVDPAVTTTFTK